MTVKTFSVTVASSLIVLLGGCASEAVKETPATSAAPAPQAAAPAPQATRPSTSAVAPRPTMAATTQDRSDLLAKRSVFYDFDQYDIKPEYRSVIEAHAAYLRNNNRATLRIEGNADERGSREYNLALGQRRADSVKRALTLMGISDQRIDTISWGEEKPSPVGHDEAAWSQHRRSDIVYTQQ